MVRRTLEFFCLFFYLLIAYPLHSRPIVIEQKKKLVGRLFVIPMVINLHQRAVKYSPTLTSLSCGDRVEAYEVEVPNKMGWYEVKAGRWVGYLEREYLQESYPRCFRNEYPRFWSKLELDSSQKYYWGRLYDLYVQGQTKGTVK